jgi:hypothetical protein
VHTLLERQTSKKINKDNKKAKKIENVAKNTEPLRPRNLPKKLVMNAPHNGIKTINKYIFFIKL